ncbi:MAG: Pyruvate kinase [Candidatus Uhrbacteria bacterium GW2011_GWA2_52_8d]|uniref:Pyruvate kinase n=1 Tax=Candidatus Uhrbacteria bacterium GW2011_GWA2_52_8d TaxID=1618979 RepID=A0A0G2AFS4_9BACT|nr:MAG: Pyruvate kinase [Candidatus Uhrbacteria bacterium GW2011_GWA2_52_8d]
MSTGDDTVIEGDGALLMKVLETYDDHIVVTPLHDGVLHPGRGVVVQDEHLKPSALTQKDTSDLRALLATQLFDAVAVSFVADQHDIERVRAVMKEVGTSLPIVAKIETALGVQNASEIAHVSDALMAARGDLAITMPWIELPASMDSISHVSRETQTPWIVATQIAEGLERFVFPTRAEICDLAHWIQTGAAGAMVSYETAFGPKPVESVEFMRSIMKRYG